MRILYWTDSWLPLIGGIEVLGAQFVREIRGRGFEPLVVTSHCERELPDHEEWGGVSIRRYRFQEAFQLRRLDLFARIRNSIHELKRSWRPQIVHLHFPGPSGMFHLHTLDACVAPLLLDMQTHVPDWDTGPNTLSGKLLRQSGWVAANSEATLRLARAACGEIETRSSVIYNGVVAGSAPPSPLAFDPPVIACIARLVPKKGVDILLRAMPVIRKRIPNARLLIAGDGPCRADLERLAESLGLTPRVEFRGWIAPERVPDFLNEAAIVVVPSRTVEPFGIVAIEAMHMARPVVASRQGGLAEVVVDGETGFLVDSPDPAQFAERILALADDFKLASQMGVAGRARAENDFSLNRCVDNYVRLYRKLAGQVP
jgi:glycosyltransferase involved in cell wall biosynthesis